MARGLRFHLDESCRFSIAKGLRLHGVDVTTSGEVGLISATDVEQLAFCHLRGRILFTHDADFVVLHDAGAEHSGVVYCHQRLRSVGDLSLIHI